MVHFRLDKKHHTSYTRKASVRGLHSISVQAMTSRLAAIIKNFSLLLTTKLKGWKWVLIVFAVIQIISIILHAPSWLDDVWWHGLKSRLFAGVLALMVWYITERICTHRQYEELSAKALGSILLIFAVFSFCDIERALARIPNTELTLYSTACFLLSWAVFRRFALLFWGPFLMIETMQAISFHTMGISFSAGVISEIVHASKEEIANFLTFSNTTMLVTLLAAIIIICYISNRCIQKYRSLRLISAGAFLLALFSFSGLGLPYKSRITPRTWMYHDVISFVSNFENGVKRNLRLIKEVSQLPSAADKPSHIPTVSEQDNVVCILHIGESVRSNHLSLNGYYRNTTPWLASRPHLYNFPRCIAAACDTCDAISTILTDATASIAYTETDESAKATVKTVSDLFHANGFYVSYHVGYEHLGFTKSTLTAAFQSTFSQLLYTFTEKADNLQESPGSVMEQAAQVLNVCHKHADKNIFFVINNEGSHGPFNHFDHSKPAFTPYEDNSLYCAGGGEVEHIINAYDNTIVHTDAYIRTIAEGLGDRPFVYIYVSDHGESLGYDSNGHLGRGWITAQPDAASYLRTFHSNDICVVPLFILTSPEFEKLHPHFAKALAQLQANTRLTAGHGHIFHTILGLFNVQTPHYRAEWDLCSDKVQPYSGPRPDSVIAAEKAQTQH